MNTKKIFQAIVILIVIGGSSCTGADIFRRRGPEVAKQDIPPEKILAWNASALSVGRFRAELLLDNDSAFERKIAAIRGARQTLDLAYYIFSDDHSSSLLSEELIAAAKRGVRVRLLLDYHTLYSNLDLLRMLVRYGSGGVGSIEVRLYNRPTDIILKDAAYMALSCAAVGLDKFGGCSAAKYAAVERAFESYLAEHPRETPDSPTNFAAFNSEAVISALYAKDFDLLAKLIYSSKEESSRVAKKESDAKPDPEAKAKAVKGAVDAAKLFWEAKYSGDSGLAKLRAKLKLALVFALFGHKVNGLYDILTAYLPVDRPNDREHAMRDWDYWTEFLHHKILLADGRTLVLGGRNIEDAYHLRKNPFSDRYVFMDSDVAISFDEFQSGIAKSYDTLWNFSAMTARLSEVEQHADNDFLMAFRGQNPSSEERIKQRFNTMRERSAEFRRIYKAPADSRKVMAVDEGASLSYLENLPFSRAKPDSRGYGALAGLEGEYGKHIHAVWLHSLDEACNQPASAGRQEVVFHNAYFFLPSNMLSKLGDMVDGTRDCRNVRITVLTNSPGTTDLNIINVVAHQSMAAFGEYYRQKRDPVKGAEFRYFEYLKQGTGKNSAVSLHSKVDVFGPNIFIGSANADVRSFMLDSNNGLYIQGAPNFVRSYLEWFSTLLEDKTLVADRTDSVVGADQQALLESDKRKLKEHLGGLIGEEGKAPPLEIEPIVELIAGYLQRIYELSRDILFDRDSDAAERFDSLFKLL